MIKELYRKYRELMVFKMGCMLDYTEATKWLD